MTSQNKKIFLSTNIRRFLILLALGAILIPQMSLAKVRRVKLEVPEAHAAVTVAADTSGVSTQSTAPEAEKVSCQFTRPEKVSYDARFLAVRKKGVVAKGEMFETEVYISNSGNVPWFSTDSGCPFMQVNLGTSKSRDRNSLFFVSNLVWDSNWRNANRIKMETKRVDPGEMAVFRFWSRAPMEDGLFREYFAPVMEGVTWLDKGEFFWDIKVGDPQIDPEKKDLFQYIDQSTNLAKLTLEGEKSIEVSIGRQKMKLKIGDIVIREFPVSTGTVRTPTPYGTTYILNKQEVRVAGSWPHYIMPKWMSFRKGGYGIHALPSLGNDNGVYWREALNHIGTRRSHGCIRLLPKDAEFAYNFTEVGTKVVVGS